MIKRQVIWLILLILIFIFFLLEIRMGKMDIESQTFLDFFTFQKVDTVSAQILYSRILRATTAICAGAGLALSGLLMQTYFRNALAGPSVLGISSGASLMVALALMATGSGLSLGSEYLNKGLFISISAIIGSGIILFLITSLSRFIKSSVSLLILGLMIGYITSAMIGVLSFNASESSLKSFVVWGLGSFSDTNMTGVLFILSGLIIGLIITFIVFRHLNILLLGENYATSMGVPVKRVKLLMIIATGILVGVITAFCGPIAFLGLAVPHLVRSIFQTADHRILLPGVILIGILLGMVCDYISRAPFWEGGLPLNTVTCLIGAPIIIYYLIKRRKSGDYI